MLISEQNNATKEAVHCKMINDVTKEVVNVLKKLTTLYVPLGIDEYRNNRNWHSIHDRVAKSRN